MQPGLLKRLARRKEVITKLCRFARLLREKLGEVSLVLYGSYARGDFNAWSDVDLIIVWDGFRGRRLPERYSMLLKMLDSLDEPVDLVPWTPEEARAMLGKPTWRKALEGCIVFADDYAVFGNCRRAECNETGG